MRILPRATGLPCWPPTALPHALAPATNRLRDQLQGRIDPTGAVREPCHSRVLESALLLTLLDRVELKPATRGRLAAYLSAHRDSPEPLDRLLARAALDGRPAPDDLLDINLFLSAAPDFTGPRKRALLYAVLLLLGATPVTEFPAPEAFSLRGLHTWARVQVTAVKAILAHAHGETGTVEERDVQLLRSTQRAATVWEGNLLIHLSVLHALVPLPGLRGVVAEGVRTALEHQRADGGMPFICDEDTWVTATAGVALHAAGPPQRSWTPSPDASLSSSTPAAAGLSPRAPGSRMWTAPRSPWRSCTSPVVTPTADRSTARSPPCMPCVGKTAAFPPIWPARRQKPL